MTSAYDIAQHYFQVSNGELRMGGLAIGELATTFGTPCYAYDSSVLEKKWQRLKACLPPRFSISYSVKANPNPEVIKFFVNQGCGLEIASMGEFKRALMAGCHPSKVVFAGPGKTPAELAFVLEKDIGEIHSESFLELDRIAAIAQHQGKPARVALRINPSSEAQGGAMRMGGKPAPFGIDEEFIDDALDQIVSNTFLQFRGIHLFTGTQILDHHVLLAQYRKGIEIAQKIVHRLQQPIHTLDFGGGWGVPYFKNDRELDVHALKEELHQLMNELEGDPFLAQTQMMVEPGRYLVGEGGVYITRVNDIKVSRGKKFIITDGGLHHHLAATGNFGQVIKRNFPVAVLNKLDQMAEETVDVVGPLCTPLDVLARSAVFPRIEIGDLIGIFQSGAYGRSASPLEFLSHPPPVEIWIERGEAKVAG